MQNPLAPLDFDSAGMKIWMRIKAASRGCRLHCGPYAWDLKKGRRVIRIGKRHFSAVTHLVLDFDQIFETLIPKQLGGQELLDFSHIQMHKHRSSGVTFELAQWPDGDALIDSYLALYLPTPKDLVFDLGAGCGISTYAFSNLAKMVVAYEPDSHLRVILERNVGRLELPNVVVARESITSLAELLALYHHPALCKVNLDRIPATFFSRDTSAWASFPAFFSASSDSHQLLRRFSRLLKDNGFEPTINKHLGVLWAEPV
jgi:hypothetical protein